MQIRLSRSYGTVGESCNRERVHFQRCSQVVQDARLPIEVEDYVNKCSAGLVDVVIQWCSGAKFADIAKMTDW